MTFSNVSNRASQPPRTAGAEPPGAPVQTGATGAASSTEATTRTAAAETPRNDQFVQARSPGSAPLSTGPSVGRPSVPPATGLVKSAESSLLAISETRGAQVAAEMRGLDKSIEAKAKDGAAALGSAASGVAGALTETKNRVLQRLGDGKVSPDEARQAMGQLDLLSDALKAVKDGNLTNARSGGVDLLAPSVKTLQFDVQ